jgi:histidinol-phosphate phosphatase family protein
MSSGGARQGRPAVFLDKDGTLVVDVPFNTDPARLRFTPEAPQALRLLADAGYLLIVVTNQSGLADGRLPHAAYAELRQALQQRLRDEAGVELDGWFTCAHPPAADGAPACACRKPAPGLLNMAQAMHGIDGARSWMVGDILDDVEAGRRAGCRTVLLDVGGETVWHWTPLREPHARCATLLDAARWILAHPTAGDAAPRSACLPQ